MIKKNINTLFILILIVFSLTIFSKNFYNEILQKYLNNPNFFEIFFSDFYLIYAGSEILNQGDNPYKEWLEIKNSPFFNPPVIFHFFKFITNFDYLITVKFWFFILFLSFIAIPILFFRIFNINYGYSFIIYLSFGGLAFSVFFTGNLSVILGAFFVLSLFFLNKKKEHIFYIILSLLSFIKFPYLIFFGIPFLLNGFSKKVFFKTFFYLLLISSAYLISFYQSPELFISWINSLRFSEVIGDGGDLGRGLFRLLNNYIFSSNYLNYFFYFLFCCCSFIFLIYLFKKSSVLNYKNNGNFAIAFAVIALSLFLPRLKSYDVLLTIPCLFFIINNLNFKINKSYKNLVKFLLFLLLFCWTSPYAPICLYAIIFIIFATDLKFNFIEKK
ncbi:MAG: hypothetical protein CFH25_00693 [Alphaproteobacteria bacterium MarineAlpha6_Bin3]|nr:MAG: hypothetical protein CFH25_00693 [Alphaproteobacteria bacterium MarineAlpha6_Bin3]